MQFIAWSFYKFCSKNLDSVFGYPYWFDGMKICLRTMKICHGILTLLNLPPPLTFGLYPPPELTPIPLPPPVHCSSIHKHTRRCHSQDLWKGQNCHVADKCIDTTFTNKYFVTTLTTTSLYQRNLLKTILLTKKVHVLIQLKNNNWFTKKKK